MIILLGSLVFCDVSAVICWESLWTGICINVLIWVCRGSYKQCTPTHIILFEVIHVLGQNLPVKVSASDPKTLDQELKKLPVWIPFRSPADTAFRSQLQLPSAFLANTSMLWQSSPLGCKFTWRLNSENMCCYTEATVPFGRRSSQLRGPFIGYYLVLPGSCERMNRGTVAEEIGCSSGQGELG